MTKSSSQWLNIAKPWYAILAGYLIILIFLSLNPWFRPVSRNEFFSPDKLDHAFAYGVMSIIIFFCIVEFRSVHIRDATRAWIASLFISMLIGVLIEIAQSLFTSNRTGSVEDAVANAIGAGMGYAVYYGVKYIREKYIEVLSRNRRDSLKL